MVTLMHSSPVRKPFATSQVSPTMSRMFPDLLVGIDVGTTMTKAAVVGTGRQGDLLGQRSDSLAAGSHGGRDRS